MMKLSAGKTYWAKANRPPPRYPRLNRDLSCDVVIVGAGITGALVGHELVKAGLNVVMLDKRPPGTGSTSASTALLMYETDTPLAELAGFHGRKNAVRAYQLGQEAIREIGRIARAVAPKSFFRPKQTLCVASDRAGLRQLKEEHRLRRAGGFPVTLFERRGLEKQFGLHFPGAIYAPGSGQVDAMALTQGLLAHHSRRRELRIFQGTHVVRAKSFSDEVRLETANRHTLRARHVIIATGYEAAPFLKPGLVKLQSSYVIASQPQADRTLWKDNCLVWETARPYFYLRTTEDRRILIGGEDEPFSDPARRDAKLPAKTQTLLRRFRKLFPAIPFEVEFAWTGTFGETPDGLPYIGAKSGAPRVLYALGYGGNGITFSQIAARILVRICQGRTSRDAALFTFDRKPPALSNSRSPQRRAKAISV
jgi:glycine/D-amino acid oxidase-like deaminating enzyme